MSEDIEGCGIVLEEFRQALPEEFWEDFDTIVRLLQEKIEKIIAHVAGCAKLIADESDKEIGMQLRELTPWVQKFIFPYRKNNGNLMANAKSRRALFGEIRPDRNILPGYRASSSMVRVLEGVE